MAVKKTALAELVEDFDLYPRHKVDETHINDLVRALTSGAMLPPIIADAKSKRIVDGWHRRRAYLKWAGTNAVEAVEFRTYKNEQALFLDSVALNASHGRKLDQYDKTRIVLKLRAFQVPDQIIAVTLHVPEPQIEEIGVRVVEAPRGTIPIKRGLYHLKGQSVTGEQEEAMNKLRSGSVTRPANELILLLENDLIDWTDGKNREMLDKLLGVLTRTLKARAA